MNLGKMKDLMDSSGVNAVVTVSPQNTYYTTGNYSLITKMLGAERLAIGIFPKQEQPVYLVSFIEELFARDESWIEDIRTYGFTEPPMKCVVDILSEKHSLDGKVAIELDFLPANLYQELTSLAPKTVFIDAADILSTLRIIKEEREIELLEFAAQAQRKAIEAAFEMARPGDTEKHVSELIMSNMLSLGFEEIVWTNVGTGSGTLRMHALPSERKLKIGDILRADCGGLIKGYYSDLARTYAVGQASEEQRQIFRALVRAQKAAIESMNVGTKISDVYNICKKTFEENYPAPFTAPFIAHGLGVVLHDAPIITAGNENRLEENMVINMEPVYFQPKAFYHVEDLVLVTYSGPKVLSGGTFDDELPIIK